jgi:GT2 family glycosyltransferase
MVFCSVIIPVYNLAAVTRRCLDHLLNCPPQDCELEVIVVDDGSKDSTPTLLASYGDRIRVVSHEQNKGFATTCNDGAKIASCEYLVFLNNDTVPLPGWLDALVDYARAHPEAGAFGSKLLYSDGTIQHAGVVVDQQRNPRHIYTGFPADHPAVNKSRRFQAVTGGCFLIAREVFERANGFDPAFVNSYEDVDLCLRLGEIGFEVHYCHKSVLFHLESVSEGRNKQDARNLRLLHERWNDRLRADDWQYYIEDGLIRINYQFTCPYDISVSPLLAVANQEGRRTETDRLLGRRSRQVRDLLRENTQLLIQNPSALSV